MARVYTATWRDNVVQALDPVTRIYDKNRIENNKFPGQIYVFKDHGDIISTREHLVLATYTDLMLGHDCIGLFGEVPESQLAKTENIAAFTIGPQLRVDQIIDLAGNDITDQF
jgi:hypothetical protein